MGNISIRRRRPTWDEISDTLTKASTSSIGKRWVALQFSREMAPNVDVLIDVLRIALTRETSTLMRHEIVFAMGQTSSKSVLKDLKRICDDESEDEVTRHEAVESIAMIDARPFRDAFRRFVAKRKELPILADTASLALEGLCRLYEGKTSENEELPFVPLNLCGCHRSTSSRTNAAAASSSLPVQQKTPFDELTKTLLDRTETLYDRYEALFELRDDYPSEATPVICRALEEDQASACFRHELAFTAGLLGDVDSERVLIAVLNDRNEHDVVRHEAAISLGSVGTSNAKRVLRRHCKSPRDMVRESCLAALAMRPFVLSDATKASNAFEFKWGAA